MKRTKIPSAIIETESQKLNLGAYGGTIEDVKELTPFTPDTPIEILQKHLQENGVLWIRLASYTCS